MKKAVAIILGAVISVSCITGCTSKDSSSKAPSQNDDVISETNEKSESSEITPSSYQREPIITDKLVYPDKNEYEEQPVIWNEPAQSGLFSVGSGVYENEFELTLSAEGEIYYTTDGSDPSISDTALKYDSPILITDRKDNENVVSAVDPLEISGNFNEVNSSKDGFNCTIKAPLSDAVDKCTVIRAVEKNPGGSFGDVQTETYFVGSMYDHINGIGESCHSAGNSLAVISISVDYDDFFNSENGIYVKGNIFKNALGQYLKTDSLYDPETARSLDANYKQRGKEWEKAAAINFFESDGAETECVLSQNCGIRIQGNYSRSDLQKGFRLFARSSYGDNNFRYEVFNGLTDDSGDIIDKFKTLTLRAGGNCAFTAKYNDTYWQSLIKSLDCDTKASRPCVVYLNGEYWGLYVLEEDYQSDYFEDHHDVNKDDVILYKGDAESYSKGYKLDLGKLPEGVSDESYYFNELVSFFRTHKNLESQDDFDEFCKLVDPQSAMDYFAVQIWINNKWDWPSKNWSMWKTSATDSANEYSDGRWRFIFYDVEFGGVSGIEDVSTNTIKEDNYKTYGLLDMGTNNPAVLCFAYLMTSESWRNEFYSELLELSDTVFDYERAKTQLDWLNDCYSPLYNQFFARYEGAGTVDDAINGEYGSYKAISDFLSERSNNIQSMIDWCEHILNK